MTIKDNSSCMTPHALDPHSKKKSLATINTAPFSSVKSFEHIWWMVEIGLRWGTKISLTSQSLKFERAEKSFRVWLYLRHYSWVSYGRKGSLMKLMTDNAMMIRLTNSFDVEWNLGLEADFRDVNQFSITDCQCIKKLEVIKIIPKRYLGNWLFKWQKFYIIVFMQAQISLDQASSIE